MNENNINIIYKNDQNKDILIEILIYTYGNKYNIAKKEENINNTYNLAIKHNLNINESYKCIYI